MLIFIKFQIMSILILKQEAIVVIYNHRIL